MSKLHEKGKILIVSTQINIRSGIRKNLLDMGFNTKLMEVASEFPQAKAMIEQVGFNVIIVDDDFGKYSAFDLIEVQRLGVKKPDQRIFIALHSGEPSPYTTSDFLIRGGDLLIAKPFKPDFMMKQLEKLVEVKSKMTLPEVSSLMIDDLIYFGRLTEAEELFDQFTDPGIYAVYSKGAIEYAKENYEEAFDYFAEAYSIKPSLRFISKTVHAGIHAKRFIETLPFIETWIEKYPLPAGLIADMFEVMIVSQQFNRVNEILDIMSTHKVQDEAIRITLAASLIVVSQYNHEKGENEKAIDYALKSIQYGGKKLPILYKSIELLVKCGARDLAESQYVKLAPDPQTIEDTVIDLQIRAALHSKQQVIIECMRMISTKVVNKELFTLTIECLREIGRDPNDMVQLARRHYPDQQF
jgi:hypothetical protein